MTALSITASQVLPVSGPTRSGIVGAALTAGTAVYFDTSAGKWKAGQCDGSAAEAGRDGYGILLASAAADGQRCDVALPGATVTLGAGAAPAAGTVYAFAAAAGSLAPVADMGQNNKVTPFALGIGSNKVKLLDGAYDAGAIVP